jgi:SAM-dependent methyltransferase
MPAPRLTLLIATVTFTAGCASTPRADPPHAAYEPAAPLHLEPRSYAASQRDHYNRVYARPESERPPANAFLLQCLDRLDASRREAAPSGHADAASLTALDIAMGDGRNTIALAQHAYRTVGFDFSDVGVNRARRRAAELGLTIDARVDTFRDDYFLPDQWDVVAMMYFGVDANDLRRVKQSVKPGGHLIMEFAGTEPANNTLAEFLDWHVIIYEADAGGRDWALKQPDPGPGPRTRLLARRPVQP